MDDISIIIAIIVVICWGGIPFLIWLYAIYEKRNEDFWRVKEALAQGKNVFITGGAGTGKSFMIKRLLKHYKGLNGCVTSTTGISALNIDGVTIHSWCDIATGNEKANYYVEKIKDKKNKTVYRKIKFSKMLAIDEISMLCSRHFELINSVIQAIRGNNKPFGGIQLIVIGDFCQLPAVKSMPKYCFKTQLWNDCKFEKIILTKVWRQKDKDFIDILNKLRFVNTEEEKNEIKEYFKDNIIFYKNRTPQQKQLMHIFGYKYKVSNHNKKRLKELDGEQKIFTAEDYVANIEYNGNERKLTKSINASINDIEKLNDKLRAPENLEIKKFCRVMLIYNIDVESGLANGSMGTVVDFDNDTITVDFDNKKTGVRTISKIEFELPYDVSQSLVRKQYPIMLAYAINVHKAQGLTLDSAVVDINSCWDEAGMVYTALSRVKTKENLYILNSIDTSIFVSDKDAVKISQNLPEFANERK